MAIGNQETELINYMQSACDKLSALGMDTLVIFTGSSGLQMSGSELGMQFLEKNKTMVADFVLFCQGASSKENSLTSSIETDGQTTDICTDVLHEALSDDNNEDDSQLLMLDQQIDTADSKVVELGEEGVDKEGNICEKAERSNDVGVSIDKKASENEEVQEGHDGGQNSEVMSIDEELKQITSELPKSSQEKAEESLPKLKMILSRVKKDQVQLTSSSATESLEKEKEDRKGNQRVCGVCHKVLASPYGLTLHEAMHKKCDICQQLFKTESVLRKHMATHTEGADNHVCYKCGKTFKRLKLLRDHHKKKNVCKPVVKNEQEVQCPRCQQMFKGKKLLEEHLGTKNNCQINNLEVKGKSFLQKYGLEDDVEVQYKDSVTGESKKSMLSELMMEVGDKSCPVCGKHFKLKYNCRRHILHHVELKPYSCEHCQRKFRSLKGLLRHQEIHNVKPHFCDKCSRCYATEDELKEHQTFQCKFGEKSHLICDLCGHKSMSKYALEVHHRTHTGIKLFSCDLCGKHLATKESVERHKTVYHQEEKPWSCDICHKAFKVKDTLKKHKKIHEEPKYKCEICGKGCTEVGNLKKHMLTHTKEKPFVCETCGKAYGRRTLLDNHQRLHTGERPYTCDECGKDFRSYSNLKQHKSTHSDVYGHICDVCGKTFKQRGRMNHHRKSHFDSYRWPCDFCEEKFKSIFMYKNHLAKCHPEKKSDVEGRTNIKLYQCDICNKMYGDKEDLTRHLYIHKGLKPFQCQFCQKAFNDKSNLRQHEKIHKGGTKHTCSFCMKTFLHNRTLQLHMKNVHSLKTEQIQDIENQDLVISTDQDQDQECKQAVDSVLHEDMIPVINEEQVLEGHEISQPVTITEHMMNSNTVTLVIPVANEHGITVAPLTDILESKF